MLTCPNKLPSKYILDFIRWLMIGVAILFATPVFAKPAKASHADLEVGRRIYLEGIFPSGKPLHGQHPNSTEVEGEDAACVKCHRRSGTGGLEGNISAPPITGKFLFADKNNRPIALLDTRSPKDVTRAHAPYTIDSLEKAISKGTGIAGKELSSLMPRYDLGKSEIKSLIAYLRQLSAELPPGVESNKIRFATIIAPDVKPERRSALINMMQAAFKQRNASQQVSAGRMRMPIDLIPRTPREWELTVWELQGNPDTWGKQLVEMYQKQPVFAVISGVSGSTWEPVNLFCEQNKLPCILPSIPLAPEKIGFYPLYFSRGVTLEAKVLAKHLQDQGGDKGPSRLIQVYRDDEVGLAAAQALTQALKDSKTKVEDYILKDSDPEKIINKINNLSDQDQLVLWVSPKDIPLIAKMTNLPGILYVSGYLMQERYDVVPKYWQAHTRIIYPYELGEKRKANLNQLNAWLKTWRMPLVDESFQSEVFFNLLLLTDLISQMLDNLYRDYLVERAEDMLSAGTNSSAYPHLGLAPGQRFASKGAYIARFGQHGLPEAETDWIVP